MPNRFSLLSQRWIFMERVCRQPEWRAPQISRLAGRAPYGNMQHFWKSFRMVFGPSGKFPGASWNGRRIKETSKLAKVEKTYIALVAIMSNLPGGTKSPCGQKILGAKPARLPAAARKLWDLQSWNRPVNRRPGKNISEVSVPATWKKQCWIVLNHSIEDDR